MNQEIFSLRWNHFKEHFTSSIKSVSAGDEFNDVTLVSDELIPFKAHKFVLSSYSPVFKEILLNNSHSHPIIYLQGVRQQELHSLLQLMYFGESTFQNSRLEILLKIIKEFDLIYELNSSDHLLKDAMKLL